MKPLETTKYTFIALLTIAIVSCAADPYTLHDWDYDDDLYLDEDEFAEGLDKMAYYDTWNYDGEDYVTEDEWNEGIDDFMGAYRSADFGTFSGWDTNGDGLLTDDEFESGIFKTVDVDDNNRIDDNEFDTWNSSDVIGG